VEKDACREFRPKRHFWANLPKGIDLIGGIIQFCKDQKVQTASFVVSGAVSMATTGVYDQKQQVFVTRVEKGDFEIVSGTGSLFLDSKKNAEQDGYFVDGQVLLSDTKGNLIGGKLFSETITFAVALDLTELHGNPITLTHDQVTGRMRKKF
jgi:predicted DNA-binding protein with PD1-like motif